MATTGVPREQKCRAHCAAELVNDAQQKAGRPRVTCLGANIDQRFFPKEYVDAERRDKANEAKLGSDVLLARCDDDAGTAAFVLSACLQTSRLVGPVGVGEREDAAFQQSPCGASAASRCALGRRPAPGWRTGRGPSRLFAQHCALLALSLDCRLHERTKSADNYQTPSSLRGSFCRFCVKPRRRLFTACIRVPGRPAARTAKWSLQRQHDRANSRPAAAAAGRSSFVLASARVPAAPGPRGVAAGAGGPPT